jgi:hypothetical protein
MEKEVDTTFIMSLFYTEIHLSLGGQLHWIYCPMLSVFYVYKLY